MAMVQNQWYHFGVGAPPILAYWDWDVHWGYGLLTHGQIGVGVVQGRGSIGKAPFCVFQRLYGARPGSNMRLRPRWFGTCLGCLLNSSLFSRMKLLLQGRLHDFSQGQNSLRQLVGFPAT